MLYTFRESASITFRNPLDVPAYIRSPVLFQLTAVVYEVGLREHNALSV
jgi:hypothetical protein